MVEGEELETIARRVIDSNQFMTIGTADGTACSTSAGLLKRSVAEFLIWATTAGGASLPSAVEATSSLSVGNVMRPRYCWSSLNLRSLKPPKSMIALPRLLPSVTSCPAYPHPVERKLSNFGEHLF
jgi:hypothetical protein